MCTGPCPYDGRVTASIDIPTLRLLVAIVEKGSLSGAAAALSISQPAASARLREFEARWRLSIVRRSPRGSTMTTDGEVVVAWARQVLHAADFMSNALEALSSRRQAALVVAASLTVAEHFAPRWLGQLRGQDPGIQAVLQVVNSEAVAQAVRAGKADLGFIETTHMPVGLSRKTVGRDRLCIVVSAGHRWAPRRTPLRREELLTESWVVRENCSGTRSTFEGALRHQPEVALEATSTAALVGAVLAGVGPAVVSPLSVTAELETGRLVEIPHELNLRRPLTAVWRSDERLPNAARELLTIAVEATRR